MPSPRMLLVTSLNFFTIGIVAAILGPALPDFARQTGSPLAAVGAVISTLFVGALIAQLTGGPLQDRLGAAPLLRVGLLCIVLGLVGLAASHALWLVLASGVLTGLGHGLVDIGTSVTVSVAAGDRNVMALNLINIFFGTGAVAGPALASLTLAWWHTALPVIWFAAILALGLLPAIALLPALPKSDAPHAAPKHESMLFRVPVLWLLGGLFFLYVGLENGMGGWLSVFVQRTTPASLGTGALVASSFWLALTGGRILATIWGHHLTPNGLLSLGLCLIFIGAALMAAGTGNLFVTALSTILMGLGCGPVFPTALALTTTRFARSPGLAASTVIGLGSVGGIILPWMQGLLLTSGHAQISITFIALLAALMGGVSVSIALRFRARGVSS